MKELVLVPQEQLAVLERPEVLLQLLQGAGGDKEEGSAGSLASGAIHIRVTTCEHTCGIVCRWGAEQDS